MLEYKLNCDETRTPTLEHRYYEEKAKQKRTVFDTDDEIQIVDQVNDGTNAGDDVLTFTKTSGITATVGDIQEAIQDWFDTESKKADIFDPSMKRSDAEKVLTDLIPSKTQREFFIFFLGISKTWGMSKDAWIGMEVEDIKSALNHAKRQPKAAPVNKKRRHRLVRSDKRRCERIVLEDGERVPVKVIRIQKDCGGAPTCKDSLYVMFELLCSSAKRENFSHIPPQISLYHSRVREYFLNHLPSNTTSLTQYYHRMSVISLKCHCITHGFENILITFPQILRVLLNIIIECQSHPSNITASLTSSRIF